MKHLILNQYNLRQVQPILSCDLSSSGDRLAHGHGWNVQSARHGSSNSRRPFSALRAFPPR